MNKPKYLYILNQNHSDTEFYVLPTNESNQYSLIKHLPEYLVKYKHEPDLRTAFNNATWIGIYPDVDLEALKKHYKLDIFFSK